MDSKVIALVVSAMVALLLLTLVTARLWVTLTQPLKSGRPR
jgi:hypothetical protein